MSEKNPLEGKRTWSRKPMSISEETYRKCPLATYLTELVPYDPNWRTVDKFFTQEGGWGIRHATKEELDFLDELPLQVLEHCEVFGSVLDLVKCYNTYLKYIHKRRFDYEDLVDRDRCAEHARHKLELCILFESRTKLYA